MHAIDPSRLDLAREFRANPVGPHSPELQKILKIMHWAPATSRWFSVQIEPDGAWHLARTTGPKGSPLQVYRAIGYRTACEASWSVFRMRWEELTEQPLRLDEDDPPDPCAGGFVSSAGLVERPLLGYADRVSVENGERIEFKVSAAVGSTYRAEIVRMRCADRSHLGLKYETMPSDVDGDFPGREQPIEAGSYVEIGDPQRFSPHAFTLLAYVWPTTPGRGRQILMGNWDDAGERGYALMLDAGGALALVLGDGAGSEVISTGIALLERHWYRVAASVDSHAATAWIAQRPITRYALGDTAASRETRVALRFATGPGFRVGACHAGSSAPALAYNGKLEAPTVASRALTHDERVALMSGEREPDLAEDLVARWDFSRSMSTTHVEDVSANGVHGQTVNLPARAMKGVHWDGSEYNFARKPEHYGAIHFHDDDLYDCGWQTDFTLSVPQDWPSGLYFAHLVQHDAQDWIAFVVRPPRGTARANLALVLPTASYWAYANRHTVIDYEGREHVRGAFNAADPTALYLHHHPELGLSMYDLHSDGSGVCYSSRLRPVLSMRPDEALWQLPADTHIIDWLDETGIPYDVLTEDDLDAQGESLLDPYRCVLTGTHPEYPSLRMLDAITAFQQRGGRFVYLGGNGFYWRVSYHPDLPGAMEMRRAEDGIRAWLAEGGEYYHSFTGELGGMWRRMGRAPQSIAGVGMTAQGFDRSTYYERSKDSFDPRAAFIFEGIADDERIGDFGIIGGGAAGWEIDRADAALGTPPHALVVATASSFTATYHWMKEEMTHTHDAITGETCPHVRCDMVFYETPAGGAVFSVSSIAWAGALAHNHYDNNVSRITRNVIERFLDPQPLTNAGGAHAGARVRSM